MGWEPWLCVTLLCFLVKHFPPPQIWLSSEGAPLYICNASDLPLERLFENFRRLEVYKSDHRGQTLCAGFYEKKSVGCVIFPPQGGVHLSNPSFLPNALLKELTATTNTLNLTKFFNLNHNLEQLDKQQELLHSLANHQVITSMFSNSINLDPICKSKELEEKDSSRLFGQRPGAKVAMVAGVQPTEVFFKRSPHFFHVL